MGHAQSTMHGLRFLTEHHIAAIALTAPAIIDTAPPEEIRTGARIGCGILGRTILGLVAFDTLGAMP
jgi:hypothetical protein